MGRSKKNARDVPNVPMFRFQRAKNCYSPLLFLFSERK